MDKPIFYDADCLESFLFVDAGYILEELFPQIIIPEQVYNELMFVSTPKKVKDNFNKFRKGFVEVKEIAFPSQEYNTFKLIEGGFWSENEKVCGPGEAAAMALAHLNNGILASNNLADVFEYVGNLDIVLITSSMILSGAFEKEIISQKKADMLWQSMLDEKILLPKNSFVDYYNELFKEDCKDFLNGKSIDDII